MPETSFESLESALRSFEPLFWVLQPGEPTDRLYDPDGTLYAFCLDGPTELCTDRRRVKINHGDLVIIPPAVAIDVNPPSRWFGISYTGPYPYHFRERFIQVWGFEHHTLQKAEAGFLLNDYRHRLSVQLEINKPEAVSAEPFFQIGLNWIKNNDSEELYPHWTLPGEPLDPNTCLYDYLIKIPTESAYLVNREAHPHPKPEQTMSPEYRPGQA